MADLTARFEDFRRRFQADGFANPQDYLEGLDESDRIELGLLIERFLFELPRRPWNEAEFDSSGAAELAERVFEAVATPGPERLKDLRDAAEISRASLVERLADALGAPEMSGRVGFYYHHLELGTLSVDGVSAAVFEALSSILGVAAERIRRAAELSSRSAGGEPIFARSVTGTRPTLEPVDSTPQLLPGAPEGEAHIDRLFTGG